MPAWEMKQVRKGGWSPLEALRWKKDGILNQRGVWESRKAFVLAPWETRIPGVIENAENARASHDRIERESIQRTVLGRTSTVSENRTILIFTDGSGYEGMVGASALAPRESIFERRHLGTTDESTVYVAELHGIEMAVARFVNQQHRKFTKLIIFSDCPAAMQAVQNPKRSSGQHVLSNIYDHVRTLRAAQQQTLTSDRIPIEIRWVPAHVGVPGIETADVEAKLAAIGGAGGAGGTGGTRIRSIPRQ
ncbi:hypothetical protein N7535_002606 [Penicillium sp. DV-2018c]|nr:hypothetical protein N7535_002606 [Penicillium sp. DV-2018c]